jgi:hypothetical protein
MFFSGWKDATLWIFGVSENNKSSAPQEGLFQAFLGRFLQRMPPCPTTLHWKKYATTAPFVALMEPLDPRSVGGATYAIPVRFVQ